MPLSTKMPVALKPYFRQELIKYLQAMQQNQLPLAWRHLERAHIIGQLYPYQHTLAHWKMLCFGIKIKSNKEVLGQLLRLLVGGVKSFVGKVPVGNTGGANVPPLLPMELPTDISALFQQTVHK